MKKIFYRIFIGLLIIGIAILNTNAAYADGTIKIPEVKEDFDEFKQDTPPKQEQPVAPPPANEEKGFLDWIKQPFVDAWNWSKEKVSGAWNWTKDKISSAWNWAKEKLSDFKNWLDGILSKVSNVVVDTLSDIRDWFSKQIELISNDLDRLINDTGNYLYEVFGIADFKAAWEKLTSDPLGYLKDAWNDFTATLSEIANDPLSFLFDFLFDKEMFLEALAGVDKDGKQIPLPNRILNMIDSLPSPTKILRDLLVPDSCHCDRKSPANRNEFPTNHPGKPVNLKRGDPDFKYEVIEKDGKHYIRTSDGREILNKYFYTGDVTKTTKQGNIYTVTYDENGFPDFEPHAKKDKDGNPVVIYLPEDAIVGTSGNQTRFATKLLKERYVKQYGEDKWKDQMRSEGFTDDQIESIDKGLSSIGAPRDYANKLTWHHDVETGKMVLVPYDLNNTFKHTGGHAIWGQQKSN